MMMMKMMMSRKVESRKPVVTANTIQTMDFFLYGERWNPKSYMPSPGRV
jgi:hypothetical protein